MPAYEVAHFDDLMVGHDHLAAGGYAHQMGVGRHILGGQIYDYWFDPFGNPLEHWTDGDLFNNQNPPAVARVETVLGNTWGPTAHHQPVESRTTHGSSANRH